MGTVVEEQLQTIQDNVNDAYTALESKGATLPAVGSRGSANLPSTINSLPKEGFPNKLWSVDANGVTIAPKGTFSEDSFDDIVEISSSKTLASAFKNIEVNGDVTFRNLTTIGDSGLKYSFSESTRPSGASKFNLSLPNVTSIGYGGCYQLAYNSSAFGSFSCSVTSLTSGTEFKQSLQGSSVESVIFPNLTSIQLTSSDAGSFYFMCWNNASLTSVSFPNLTTITTPRISSSEGEVFGGAFRKCTSLTSISFPELTTITGDSSGSYNSNSFFGVCQDDTSLLTASFPKLTTISGDNATFQRAFQGCKSLTSVDFSLVKKATSNCFAELCSGCESLTTAKFDSLEEISSSAFYFGFTSCKALTTISFQSLTKIGTTSFQYCFQNCTGLRYVSFPLLENIGIHSFEYTFKNCTALTTISFPSLTTVDTNAMPNCFRGCTALTEIHFPAAIKSTIEGLTGYDTKWGATNATIYFDL